jgi:hypothetical protein
MKGLLSATTTDLSDIVNKEYNDARIAGSMDHVIGAYFSGVEIVVIVAPTLAGLCSLSTVIFTQEKKIYNNYEYRVITRDIRSFELTELQRLVRVSIRCFNQDYVNYINTNNLAELIINVINGTKDSAPNYFEDFCEKITDKEKIALVDIIKRIGSEGYVSLSGLILVTGISRPVYNNLFMKLKDCHIADVTAAGAKGTHIKFLNLEILNLVE